MDGPEFVTLGVCKTLTQIRYAVDENEARIVLPERPRRNVNRLLATLLTIAIELDGEKEDSKKFESGCAMLGTTGRSAARALKLPWCRGRRSFRNRPRLRVIRSTMRGTERSPKCCCLPKASRLWPYHEDTDAFIGEIESRQAQDGIAEDVRVNFGPMSY